MLATLGLSVAACGSERETIGGVPTTGGGDGDQTSGDASGDGDGDGDSGGGSGGSGDGDGDGDSSGGSGGDGDGDGDIRFDIGFDSDGGGADGSSGEGCEKIDFLFVVDNSGSMGAFQTNLVNSFGPFMDTIFDSLEAQDYHIMVVDSDAGEDIDGCPFWCNNNDVASLGLDPVCESAMGAGEVAPLNQGASNRVCGVPDGRRYLTSDLDPATITDTFACMATVGTFGSGGEKPVTAAVEALTTQAGPGACNDGFLRDDAILVVTFITDDYPVDGTADDAGSFGSVDQWYDAIVAAKSGIASNIVMLGVINLANSTCISDGSAGGPVVHPTQKFVDFVGRFGARGITGDICAPDYNGFFQGAVSLIDTACDEFTPVG